MKVATDSPRRAMQQRNAAARYAYTDIPSYLAPVPLAGSSSDASSVFSSSFDALNNGLCLDRCSGLTELRVAWSARIAAEAATKYVGIERDILYNTGAFNSQPNVNSLCHIRRGFRVRHIIQHDLGHRSIRFFTSWRCFRGCSSTSSCSRRM